jgi:uncharacterized phage-associated protein
MSGRHKAPVVKMEPQKQRILEALLYLISEADKRKIPVTQYSLLKALFLADRSHLNRFGRPITFDNYVAMDHGPVPSFAYTLLKNEVDLHKTFGTRRASLWDRTEAPEYSKNTYLFSKVKREPNLDALSKSEVDALSDALAVVSRLSFQQLRKLTHEDPAYVDAWEEAGGKKAYPMSYALLFDVPNFDQASDIAFASKHA